MIFIFFYDLFLLIAALCYLPFFLISFFSKGKYQKSLLPRFGRGFPTIEKNGRPLIWIHAVSFGETRAIEPLVKSLISHFDHPIILFSSTTETGFNEAKKIIPAHHHVYMPLDLSWIIGPIVKKVKPDLVILCESDYWANFLYFCKKENAMCTVVNAKVSERSMKRFCFLSFFTKRLFSFIDHLYVQSQIYYERFLKIGIPPSKMTVTGNIKFDTPKIIIAHDEINQFEHDLGIHSSDFVLVIGSTHDPEEKEILEAIKPLWNKIPHFKVLIVPRHPERFDLVENIIREKGLKITRLSTKKDRGGWQVLLVDTMGMLRKCFQIADIAIVAGSYTEKVGGHNVLEPSMSGIPVIFGPYMHSQPDLVEIVLNNNLGFQIPLAKLSQEIERLYFDPKQRRLVGENALQFTDSLTGATNRTLKLLLSDYKKFKNHEF